MRFAYADPPYLGWSQRYYGELHEDAADYDKPETHQALIDRLCSDFDGWAMSLHSPALRTILPMCPDDVRVMAWCKSFASYKPGVHPAYAWEPVIIRGPQKRTRTETTVADFHVARITLERGLTGAKPASFVWWVLAALNVKVDDELVDIFPGSGAVGRAWDSWRAQLPLDLLSPATATPEAE
jgi:hypothetical protein